MSNKKSAMDSKQIFVSYAREDQDFAFRLAKDLHAAGQVIWMDQLKLKSGEEWDVAIEAALEESPNVLLVLSPSSVNSRNVRDEIDWAIENGKRVIPVLFKKCSPWLRIRRLQWIDFTGDYDEALLRVVDQLKDRLSRPMPVLPQPAWWLRVLDMSTSAGKWRAASVGLFVTLIALTTFGVIDRFGESHYTEIVLDRSANMDAAFGELGQSKLDAAVNGIRSLLPGFSADIERVAFRMFGGECDTTSQLLVPFSAKRESRSRIDSILKTVEPAGNAALVTGVKNALHDLAQQSDADSRRVVVVTGNTDDCGFADPAQEIQAELDRLAQRGTPIDYEFRFIFVSPDSIQAQSLSRLNRTLGGQAFVARTPEDLDRGLQFVLVFEKLLEPYDAMEARLNAVAQHFTHIGDKVVERNHLDAASDLRAARDEFNPSAFEHCDSWMDAPIDYRDTMRELFNLTCENFEVQKRLLVVADSLVKVGLDAHELVREWNEKQEQYEKNRTDINLLVGNLTPERAGSPATT